MNLLTKAKLAWAKLCGPARSFAGQPPPNRSSGASVAAGRVGAAAKRVGINPIKMAVGVPDVETLLRACDEGDLPSVRIFLERLRNKPGFEPDLNLFETPVGLEARDRHGQTALALAANGGFVPIVDLLIEAGSDLEARDMMGNTPLLAAVRRNETECMKRLLAAGADIRARQYGVEGIPTGPSGVELAAFYASVDAMDMLISARAADISGVDGCRAARAAVLGAVEKMLWHAGSSRAAMCLRRLIQAGCCLGVAYKDGQSAAHVASERGEADFLAILIEAGVDIEALDAGGCSPSMLADASSAGGARCLDLLGSERARREGAELARELGPTDRGGSGRGRRGTL